MPVFELIVFELVVQLPELVVFIELLVVKLPLEQFIFIQPVIELEFIESIVFIQFFVQPEQQLIVIVVVQQFIEPIVFEFIQQLAVQQLIVKLPVIVLEFIQFDRFIQ